MPFSFTSTIYNSNHIVQDGGMDNAVYSARDITHTYNRIQDCIVTRDIIRTYSTNARDIREVAIEHIDRGGVRSILDLGCGYGFFIEKLKGAVDPRTEITGVDIVGACREQYMRTIASLGCGGDFIASGADIVGVMDDASVDLVICCYSLYFFPQIVSDIYRVLRNGGVLLAITHSENTLREAIAFIRACMKTIGLAPPRKTALSRLFMEFSLENGTALLGRFFDDIEVIPYANSMVFDRDSVDDCVCYIEKKRLLMFKEVFDSHPEKVTDMEVCIATRVRERAQAQGRIVLNKNDGIFICRKSGKLRRIRH